MANIWTSKGSERLKLVLPPALMKQGRWRGWEIHLREQPTTQNLLAIRVSQDYLTILDYLLVRLPFGHRHLLIHVGKTNDASIGSTIPETAETLARIRRLGGTGDWSLIVL